MSMDEERIAMMGQLDSGQDKLFYSFKIDMCLEPICCEASSRLSISVICVSILLLSTVRSVDLQLIRNS